MTEKHARFLSKEEYAQALRAAMKETAAPPAKPRKPTAVQAMTPAEYIAAKKAVTAKQTNR